ncbi:hypothetical protein [Luteibacter sp. dw_328]|uniref:hypothetical protein n=1 Tax=Luteibacter sp. dw_328 TaxID=2719796 RepID=UPI001BD46CAE|nr:hypothetical protein [Luteibacter sp. dw_328]
MDQHHRTRRHFRRSWAKPTFLFLGVVLATSAQAAPHFVTFINDADRTVTSVEAAPAGTRHWHALDLGGPLIGGRSGQATVRFDSAEVCKQDLSVTYRGLAPLTITGFDICRTDRLYLGKALAKARNVDVDKVERPVSGDSRR